jgi:dipeptide/tripeptide permease
MRGVKPLVIIGAIILILGLIFHLQGQSVIGPESSFMYSNPEWITYGIQIVIVGIIIVVVGTGISIIKRN